MSISTKELDRRADTDLFDLDVTVLELADSASLINMTDDGCGSTCGACVTGAA
jgi:FxLD family lantipeptide